MGVRAEVNEENKEVWQFNQLPSTQGRMDESALKWAMNKIADNFKCLSCIGDGFINIRHSLNLRRAIGDKIVINTALQGVGCGMVSHIKVLVVCFNTAILFMLASFLNERFQSTASFREFSERATQPKPEL